MIRKEALLGKGGDTCHPSQKSRFHSFSVYKIGGGGGRVTPLFLKRTLVPQLLTGTETGDLCVFNLTSRNFRSSTWTVKLNLIFPPHFWTVFTKNVKCQQSIEGVIRLRIWIWDFKNEGIIQLLISILLFRYTCFEWRVYGFDTLCRLWGS